MYSWSSSESSAVSKHPDPKSKLMNPYEDKSESVESSYTDMGTCTQKREHAFVKKVRRRCHEQPDT